MKFGDLLQYKGQYWIVQQFDPKRTRLATIVATSGHSEKIPFDADLNGDAVVLGNPAVEWPYVVLKERPKFGKILRILKLSFVAWDGSRSATPIELQFEMYRHWVPSDPVRCGGSIFLSPTLNLQAGDTLQAVFERGTTRFIIPANFQTVTKRMALLKPKPRIEKTIYNHLLEGDFDEPPKTPRSS